MRPKRPPQGERGQVLILVAFALVALLGMLALVADVGLLYLGRARSMNAAEAAALAGVQHLPDDPAQARTVALEYVSRNGLNAGDAEVEVSQNNTRLDVKVRQEVPLVFARILGFETAPVHGEAAVVVSALRRLQGAAPLGVEKQSFTYGATYQLKNAAGYSGSYKGNFGCLALGGRGASVYRENLANGYQGILELGDVVETEPGNMSGPTTQGINARLEADPTGTYDNHRPDSPRILKVPVVEWGDLHGRSTAKIVGFAAFWLEGVGGSGNQNYVTGRFLRLLTSDGEGGTGNDTSYNYGLYTYRLVK